MFFGRKKTASPEIKNEILENSGIVIDCRTASERASGMVKGALTADWLGGELHSKVKSLDPSKHYYLYCRSGARSGQATSFLKSHGFTHVTNLGGYDDVADLF